MRVYIAMDSFKGSLTSLEAGNTVRDAILSIDPATQVIVTPIADGGEGTVDALSTLKGSQIITKDVCGPLGQPVSAVYCILADGTAVIEMAAAAGLTLVPQQLRNPLHTTTYGVGELIRDAISRGCRDFIIGIGGSATNDGGIGMLTALGYAFTNKDGDPIANCGQGLSELAHISRENVCPDLSACTFRIACDVRNPLCGKEGCSAVYGPQKGADPATVAQMDTWLQNYAIFSGGDPDIPGSGAAGGLGYAFHTYLNAELRPGIDIILEKLNASSAIQASDMVITGEGRLDGQSAQGKTPVGIASLAKKYSKKVIVFAGSIGADAEKCVNFGIDAYFSIIPGPCTLENAMQAEVAQENLFRTALQVFRLLLK